LQRTEHDLVREYSGRVPAQVMHRYVDDALGAMDAVLIPEFLPALVCREVRNRAQRYGGSDHPNAAGMVDSDHLGDDA